MLLLPKRKPVLIMSIDRIALEQLDGEQREIAELIGIESYKKACKIFWRRTDLRLQSGYAYENQQKCRNLR